MLSKGKVKYIHSLEMKKYRNELNAFVAEGNKLVADMRSEEHTSELQSH